MTGSDIHERPGVTLSTHESNTMFHHLGCLPALWMTEGALCLNLHMIHYMSVFDRQGKKKVPDGLHGVSFYHETYPWSYIETAKSQGLYTSPTNTNTVNCEGVLNKIHDFLRHNISMWQVSKSQQLIAADCFNVKEMMPPNGTKKWASGLDEKQDFRITDLRLETAVFDTLQQQLTRMKPDHAGLLARSGPYYAKPRDPNSTVGDTCFGGPYCAMWFHFSASDPRAL
ncbi:hypothetical protein FOMPIDRAFT_1018817 [Fomitopsis schrenkii]|uniref:Uncharacterized protein n=1 Tax=Fomitopsis schrenkii TaxID=2126942 RepID=S8F3W1_FOMSC|nr:hypothetical protein FOMPIDRAFT_1018817 [Fomitopsis schrenkii]